MRPQESGDLVQALTRRLKVLIRGTILDNHQKSLLVVMHVKTHLNEALDLVLQRLVVVA